MTWNSLLSSLFLCFVYNKSSNTRPVKKQDFLKYRAEKNPTHQIDSFEEEIVRKFFAEADSLDKNLPYLRIKLPKSQLLFSNGVETEVLLSKIAQQLRCNNADDQDLYFSLLCFNLFDAAAISPTMAKIKILQPEMLETGSHSKYETQKLQKFNLQDGAAYGSVQTLVEGSSLPVSKVRQSLRSKLPITNFTVATSISNSLKAIAMFKNNMCFREKNE